MRRALTTCRVSSWKPSKATPACASPPKIGSRHCAMPAQGRCASHPRRDSMRHGTHRQALGSARHRPRCAGGGQGTWRRQPWRLAASKPILGSSRGPSLGHITTFGGHPMACAGAIGALGREKLDFAHVERQNQRWQDALEGHPAVRTVRRLGAFIAVELRPQRPSKAVEAGLHRSNGEGVLLFWFLSVPHAFRLAPPHLLGRGNGRRSQLICTSASREGPTSHESKHPTPHSNASLQGEDPGALPAMHRLGFRSHGDVDACVVRRACNAATSGARNSSSAHSKYISGQPSKLD